MRGMSLIEILVAVLILSIGALGIALMQTHALANNNSSMSRSLAVLLNYSMLDAMRIDRSNALAPVAAYDGTVYADQCPAAGATLASVQINDWCRQLGNAFGAVHTTRGTINCTANPCTVSVTYDDSRIGNVVSSATNAAAASAGGSTMQTVTTQTLLQ